MNGDAVIREIRARYSKGAIEPLEELDDIQEGEEIVIVVKKAPSNDASKGAFERAAGAWKGVVDTDQLLKDFRESRRIRTPEVRL